MKTPAEIKKGIECCLCDPMERRCEKCPYADGGCESWTCERELGDDTVALIQQYEKIVFEQNMAILRKQNVITRQERVRSDLQEEIWQLKQQVPKWISVKERFPEGRVLAACFDPEMYCHGEYIIGHLGCMDESEYVIAENDHEILDGVTHWVSLPEPPEEEEDEEP